MSDELENDPFEDFDDDDADSEGSPRGEGTGFLGRWFVLYPLCAAVLVAAVYLGMRLKGTAEETVQVSLVTEPENATVLEAGKELVPDDDGTFPLAPGKHRLTFRKEGYEERTDEFEISPEQCRFEVELEEISGTAIVVQVVPPDAELRVDGILRKTSGGKAEFRAPVDKPLVLEASHPDFRGFRRSYSPEELESIEYRLRVELIGQEGLPGLPSNVIAGTGAEIDRESNLPRRAVALSPSGEATLELVLIAPGTFQAGVAGGELYPGELPTSLVEIESPFYIATTEITNEQYAQFADAVGPEKAGTEWKALWESRDEAEGLPVVGVSFDQAEAYCAWLGGRLPSEQQWEYAARGKGNDGPQRPWGMEPLDPGRANLFFAEGTQLVSVDSLPDGDTPDGLKHMLGNAAEWCADPYQCGFAEDGSDPEFVGKRTVRGCSFMKSPDEEARLTWRAPEDPQGSPDIGFRIVFEVETGVRI